ncbi:hypothetical protein WA538_004260 [Blastocystis sp. DL]
MRTGLKVFACSEHTMSHIPILKADMKKMFCVLNPSDKTKHNASVIMLHGVGDTGFFMVPYAADLSRSLPNVRFICPTAPYIYLTARERAKVHAWFDFPSWDEAGNNKCEGVEESCDYVNSLIQKEIDEGVDPSKIILCGFSQGAGIAIETGFGRDLPVGGIISFCGCLPNDQKFTVKEQAKKTPIMLFHGTADKHVPYPFIVKATEFIKQRGAENVELNTYPGVKHKITRRMLDLSREFLETKLEN